MIVRSIRLKNIKSFGDGPDGEGVVVSFEPGVNRIAGRNGHGKSTLIESLGYALFLTNPQFEENFQVGTFFLRNDKKTGEIDVTFEVNGETFRVERGIGSASKRRSKVTQLDDSSMCAEGEKEVEQFLCTLFEFDEAKRLTELFSKLIGVRQGRLTIPFDSKPSASKHFFEPLLNVEIFDRCHKELMPPLRLIEGLQQEQEKKLAAAEERINDRADSGEKVNERKKQVVELKKQLAVALKKQEKARQLLSKLETKEIALRKAETEQGKASAAAMAADDRLKTATEHVAESTKAAETVAATTDGGRAYLQAEKVVKELRVQQSQQAELQKKKAKAENDRTRFEAGEKSAVEQAGAFAKQKAAKQDVLETTRKTLEPLEKSLAESEADFAASQKRATQLQEDAGELKPFIGSLDSTVASMAAELEKVQALEAELADWDEAAFSKLTTDEQAAVRSVETLRKTLAETGERRRSLSEQLGQISGGVCPFLKEPCQQFDPKRVTGNVELLSKEFDELRQKLESAEKTHAEIRQRRDERAGQAKQRTVKQENLKDRIESYLGLSRSLLPENVASAAAGIQSQISDSPSFPVLPSAPAGPEFAEHAKEFHEDVEKFVSGVIAWRDAVSPKVKTVLGELEAAKSNRRKDSQERDHLKNRLGEISEELRMLDAQEKEQQQKQEAAEKQKLEAASLVSELEVALKEFADLPTKIETQEAVLKNNRESHDAFLAATPLANLLVDRKKVFSERTDEKSLAEEALKKRNEALFAARDDFDHGAFAVARTEHEVALDASGALKADLGHAESNVAHEELRFEQWKKAQEQKALIDLELDRLRAAVDLAQLARKVLKASAPAVAQHLCNRIADRAQQIFNQISDSPIDLSWESKNYSLRITPGERRFAMLSGGEQTKLALAMTLSMTREFSGLKFCIFDEPTYGVDAESRPLLARAVLDAQEAAGLEQLLLVSHDDAFEGQIEHTILLEKSAGGSRVAALQ